MNGSEHWGSSKCHGLAIPRWRTAGNLSIRWPPDLTIREVGRDEVASARSQMGETIMDGYAESVGREGFHHYMAFDSSQPVAVAALVRFEDIGYLTYAVP